MTRKAGRSSVAAIDKIRAGDSPKGKARPRRCSLVHIECWLSPRDEILDGCSAAGVGAIGNRLLEVVTAIYDNRPECVEFILASTPGQEITMRIIPAPIPEVSVRGIGKFFKKGALLRRFVRWNEDVRLIVQIHLHVDKAMLGKQSGKEVPNRIIAFAQCGLAALADELEAHPTDNIVHGGLKA